MEKYSAFESWLKTKGYVSGKSYLSFMKAIEKDLQASIENINSISVLKQLLLKLESSRSFMARGKSDKSNILSGFRCYIDFLEDTKNKTK